MNSYEKSPSQETPNEIALCQKAITVYWRGYFEYSKVTPSKMTEQDILYKSTSDATALAENSEGLRYGAPGWSQAKIEYAVPPDQDKDEKYFFISANGMNETDFQKWQKYVGEKFEANGLKFHYL